MWFFKESIWVDSDQQMKNFRSSKNLRVIEGPSKEESSLRLKVRALEEQVEMLQKSNLNIFIPLSEQESKQSVNFQAIINKLKTQILNLQQELQGQKNTVKKLESERNMMKITHQHELSKLQEVIEQLKESKETLEQEVNSMEMSLQEEREVRATLEKGNIEMKVEIRFLKDDLTSLKKRLEHSQKRYEDLHLAVLAVNHHSRIFQSRKVKVTAIVTAELVNLRSYIEDLQQKIREMMEANRKEKITLGVKRENIGEEIVRLKKNIDLQLGLPQNDESTKSFLQVYKDTAACFDGLIRDCKR